MNSQPPPAPFGDPTNIRRENRSSILKGVGLGCGGCGAIVMGLVLLIAAGIVIVFSILGNCDVADRAMMIASSSEAVRREIGQPIERGWFTTGNLSTSGDSGSADLKIPISGPLGAGSIVLVAKKKSGYDWEFEVLEVEVAGKPDRIKLLAPALPAEAPQ